MGFLFHNAQQLQGEKILFVIIHSSTSTRLRKGMESAQHMCVIRTGALKSLQSKHNKKNPGLTS